MGLFNKKPILYSTFVATGSALGIIVKELQTIKSYNTEFKHPFINCLILHLSEFTGIITYYLIYRKEDIEEIRMSQINSNTKKTQMEIHLISIPAIFEFFSTAVGNLSYVNLSASISTMFDGGNTIGVFLLSIFFLKNKHNKYNFIGVGLLLLGLFFISLSAIKDDSKETDLFETIVGIICCLLCNVFSSFHSIAEEYLLKTRFCHPIKLIGFEGLFGIIFTFFFILVFDQVRCPKSIESICIRDDKNGLFLDNLDMAYRQIKEKKIIFVIIFIQFLVYVLYNYSYIIITDVADAATNVVLYNLNAVFIWIFFLLPIDKENQEKIDILQIIGFIVLTIGVFIYNEILVCNNGNNYKDEKNEKVNTKLLDSELVDETDN